MIYIECDADEVLIKEMGFSRRQFIHQGGKFEVCKRMQKTVNCHGLIEFDHGKSDPKYLRECRLTDENHDVKTYLHPKSGNRLIVLHNDLEDWSIRLTKKHGLNLTDFGLESDRDRMHRLMPAKLNNYQRLIRRFIELEIPELNYLKAQLTA